MDIDATVTNVKLRFERDAKLPVRPRSKKNNQFVVDNLEDLRRVLMRDRGRRKLSN